MATVEVWIQIENHAWDVSPNNIDRITGQTVQQRDGTAPVTKTLTSPVTGQVRSRTMFKPLSEDALILRRYTPNWAAPDDRKVNPWDLNEPDPTDNGTMGTIPGATIEANVGDTVLVHFRNMDQRTELVTTLETITLPGIDVFGIHIPGREITFPITREQPLPVERRAHSLHTHGFVFAPAFDGAYPLSPPDTSQPIPAAEAAAWSSLGVTSLKKGDRVPPEGTFTYRWETFGWPTTAGVWLYHDHSICDDDNVEHGAIGIVVIHNPTNAEDQQDVVPTELPGGSPNGSPLQFFPFPLPFKALALPHDLEALVAEEAGLPMAGMAMGDLDMPGPRRGRTAADTAELPATARLMARGELVLALDAKFKGITHLFLRRFRSPPAQAQYLQLYHLLRGGAGVCINGRKYLGSTPTMVGGESTLMRFGVVGMGSEFHTFHIHGHRWTLPGPDGITPTQIQNSPQVRAVSQFEDTRTFGPANSFVFSIDEGTGFMRAEPGGAVGEWHMHCHVLAHMMDGMMGSLLIVQGGELFFGLPRGVPCPDMPSGGNGGMDGMDGGPKTVDVDIRDNFYSPATANIKPGDTVRWTNKGGAHTVTSNPGSLGCSPASSENFAGGTAASPLAANAVFSHVFPNAGSFAYHCEVHGCGMAGTVQVSP